MAKKEKAAETTKEKVYTRDALLRSKRFAGYQKDFLAAVLCKDTYTLAEADKAVKAFFGKEPD